MKTNKIYGILLIICLLVLMVNTGVCQQSKIDNIVFATGAANGTWWIIGAGIAEKANEFFQGFPITAIPGPGSVGNPPLVSKGEAFLGMSYPPFLILAREGKGPYDQTFTNLRSVCTLTPTVVHIFADEKIDVTTVDELIDQKIKITMGVPPTGQGSNYITKIIFSAMGYDNLEEIEKWGSKIYYADGDGLVSGWRDRHINVLIQTLNVPASAVTESLTSRKGKILSFGDKLMDELVVNRGFSKFIIPASTYPDQEKDISTVALPIVVFTRDDVPEDIIYNIVKSIYENKDYLIKVHNSFESFDPKQMASGLGIQLHKGAEKFYKEVGLIK